MNIKIKSGRQGEDKNNQSSNKLSAAAPAAASPVPAPPEDKQPETAPPQTTPESNSSQEKEPVVESKPEQVDDTASAEKTPEAPPAPSTEAQPEVISTTTNSVQTTESPAAEFAQAVAGRAASQRAIDLGIDQMTEQLQAAIIEILDNGTPLAKGLISGTLDYLSKMGPRTMVPTSNGENNQIQFYRLFQNAINNGGSDFRKMFNVFLRIIFETKDTGAFQLQLIMRFLPSINLSADDRQAFQNLMFLFRQTSGVETRALALKQFDLKAAVSKGLTQLGQQRLLTFYQA